MTVLRLYDKYELAYSSPRDEYNDKMRSQYDFARDNIQTLGVAIESVGSRGIGGDGVSP